MAKETINVEFGEIEKELVLLSAEVKCFGKYTKDFIEAAMDKMEGNCSDFFTQFEKLLRAMKDTDTKKIVKQLKTYEEDISELKKAWAVADEAVTGRMNNKGGKK